MMAKLIDVAGARKQIAAFNDSRQSALFIASMLPAALDSIELLAGQAATLYAEIDALQLALAERDRRIEELTSTLNAARDAAYNWEGQR